MAAPAKWLWSASNGEATAEETAAAYNALTHPQSDAGRVSYFKSTVWDDIVSKISSLRQYWGGSEWDSVIAPFVETKMVEDHIMSAVRFNSAVNNFPFVHYVWPWEKRLNRKSIQSGDACVGEYFINLTDAINFWIDLLPLSIKAAMQAELENSLKPDLLIVIDTKPESSEYILTAAVKAALTTATGIGGAVNIQLSTSADMWCGYINDVICALFFLHSYSASAATALARYVVSTMAMSEADSILGHALPSVPLSSGIALQTTAYCDFAVKQSMNTGAALSFLWEQASQGFVAAGMPMKPFYSGYSLLTQARAFAPLGNIFAVNLPHYSQASASAATALAVAFSAVNAAAYSNSLQITLPIVAWLLATISGEQDGEATVGGLPSAPIGGSGTAEFEAGCTFAMAVPTLAVELDYLLASDLDDQPIENVEYKMIL